MTPKLKKIILTIIILAILFVVYAVFFKKDPTAEALLNTGAGSPEAQAIGSQISQALLRIEQIKLDKSIFNNVLYKALVDRSEPISDEPIGRSNPFAPIGDISVSSTVRSAVATSTTATTTKSQTTNPPVTTSPAAAAAN